MSGSRRRKYTAFATAFAVLFALVVPFMGTAAANHETFTLNTEQETADNPIGTFHTLTATVNQTPTNHAIEVDFEVDCITGCSGAAYTREGASGDPEGGNAAVSAFDTPTDGDQVPENVDDTRGTPELSCTIEPGTTSCQVSYSRNNAGQDFIASWVDEDRTNAAGESDTAEGPREGSAGGNATEPDDTDVVDKTWFAQQAGTPRLDCQDNDTTDQETNPPGEPETYTCRAFREPTGGATPGVPGDDTPIAGVTIDAEQAGANDPDNRGFGDAANTTADYNPACTTDQNGTCTFTLTPSQNAVGTATVCFWIDEDNDAQFSIGGARQDGGECDTETALQDETNENTTDVVEKTWATAGQPTTLDAEPETDNNVKGTTHTVTATVRDNFNNPAANVPVDFNIEGRNDNATGTPECNNILTNAQGVATCTYTDRSPSNVGPEPDTDTITACVDSTPNTEGDVCAAEGATVEDADTVDTVQKFWFTTVPTAAGVTVDMDPDATFTFEGCNDNDAAATAATNPINTNHQLCGVVTNATGGAVQGHSVTLTLTGPGNFVNESGTPGDRTDDVNRGQTITVTTDANGVYRAVITSNTAGTSTVTANAGNNATDSATKTWTAGAARTIDCEPETGTNPTATTHDVTCTVRDRDGNPVPNIDIDALETGPGRISEYNPDPITSPTDSAGADAETDAEGQVVITLTTTQGEEGEQTLQVTINENTDAGAARTRTGTADDPCERAANVGDAGGADAGAPAGQCQDTVTKTWTDEQPPPPAQCDNGADDDGDGRVDMNDPGCESPADDDETNEITKRKHERRARIKGFEHIRFSKNRRQLQVKAKIAHNDDHGFGRCQKDVPVLVQIRAEGHWIDRKTGTTNDRGIAKILIQDIKAKYRVKAPRILVSREDRGRVDICRRAVSPAKRHGGRNHR